MKVLTFPPEPQDAIRQAIKDYRKGDKVKIVMMNKKEQHEWREGEVIGTTRSFSGDNGQTYTYPILTVKVMRTYFQKIGQRNPSIEELLQGKRTVYEFNIFDKECEEWIQKAEDIRKIVAS